MFQHRTSSANQHASVWSAFRRHIRSHPRRYFVGAFAVVLSIIVLVLPSAYVVETPGPTQNVLGKDKQGQSVIQVSGVTTYPTKDRLLLVTVNASGVPGYPITNAQVLWAWANPNTMITPSEAVFPVGQNANEYKKEADKQMSSSQDAAITAGLQYARSLGVADQSAKVTMHVDDIGGPSAGMMYALGLVDMLTEHDEANGQTVAGTGTINDAGEVGAIGGIRLKMIGAKRDGATWFLAPAANCDQVVGHVPNGLRDVKVESLDEAYQALVAIGQGKGDTLAHCAVEHAQE